MRRALEYALGLIACGALGYAMAYCFGGVAKALPPEPNWTALDWKLEAELARLAKVEGAKQ